MYCGLHFQFRRAHYITREILCIWYTVESIHFLLFRINVIIYYDRFNSLVNVKMLALRISKIKLIVRLG
jgi:hypothetical protein